MSRFLDSISTIISIFHKHAQEDGNSSTLSRSRMKEFIQREFADALVKPHDPQTIEKILQFLEWDGDGEIDFNEFLLLVFRVAKCCYWYLPKAPYLLQRTKLPISSKTLREPEIKSRGSRSRQLQEEEQTRERNHPPPREPEQQRDTRVNEIEVLEETRRDRQERNIRSRNNEEQSREPGETIPQEYQERSREPWEQRGGQRRRQPPEPDRWGEEQLTRGRAQERELRLVVGEREDQEESQQEELEDVRICSRSCEPQPRPNWRSGRRPQEPEGPECDERNQRPRGADGGSDNQPHRPGLLREERSRYHQHEVEQRELERSSHRERGLECLDLRHPHQSYLEEPLELDLRRRGMAEPEGRVCEQRTNQERETEYAEREREIQEEQEREEQDDRRRKGRERERRVDHQRELEISERQSRQTREREERGPTTDLRETREREGDGRRERESVRYDRTRETREAAEAEADVKVRREIRELVPLEELRRRECSRDCEEEERRIRPRREREEPVLETRVNHQREVEVSERRSRQTREREERGATTSDRVTRELEGDGRRERESVRYDRTRETREAAEAEADVKVRREIRELVPLEELRRRECSRDCEEEERRICPRREREEPVLERMVDRQQELEVSERRSRLTWEREERVATTDLRETREPGEDGRRECELERYERAREIREAEAEANVKVRREIRELVPLEELRRRECSRDCEEEERRIQPRRKREDPVLERIVDRQREVEVSERRSRQTREREERGATTSDRVTRELEGDGRRERDLVRYERTRETREAEAEADVKVRREIRELVPLEELRRRECSRDCEEEERRICPRREREEPVLETRVDRQRELEVSERRSRQTREREERGATTDLRETREPGEDGRRERELQRYGRAREIREAAEAEADVKVRRNIRELVPLEELRRRECSRDCEEEERRIRPRRERGEPVLERIVDRQRELEVSERRSRQTRDREERGPTTSDRVTRELEVDGRRERESVRYDRTRETREAAEAETDVKVHREIQELVPLEELRRRECSRDCEEEERRIRPRREREEPVIERRINLQRDLEVSERRSRLTREREERGATTSDRVTRELEGDGRRERDLVRYERTREIREAEAEANAKVRREIRELVPLEELRRRECSRDCEEEERRIHPRRERGEPALERIIDRQRELEVSERRSRQTRDREETGATNLRETRELEGDGRRERDLVRYERTREAREAEAEADVKVRRDIRELVPLEELRRRECSRDCEEEERRIRPRREREEPVIERRINLQRDLEVSERRSRQTRDREERGATTSDRVTRELEGDGRRERELERYERARETRTAEAEADVKVRRDIRELVPLEELRRRECSRDCEEEERRIRPRREREEPVLERIVDRQRELEVSERRSRQTRDREERGATTSDRVTRELEGDGRRERELERYERARETRIAETEADVKVRRDIRELVPLEELRRRECSRDCEEEERRIRPRREREEPVLETRVDRQRELEVSERHSRQTREREERVATTDLRETREPGEDGRRERELERYGRAREIREAAEAETDVKVRRNIRELVPLEELRRRECPRDCEEEERRIHPRREREEPVLETRVDRQRELEVSERRSRQTWDREERGPTTSDRVTRELEGDGRRERELERYERARETRTAEAEADVKVRREIRELVPLEELRRRECSRDCEEEERRIRPRREREEPALERIVDRQWELEVSERRSRQTRDREERGATTSDRVTRELEGDGRRERESARYERARETRIAEGEADVKVRRDIRELVPLEELRRRECSRDCEEEERRILPRREREEPVLEMRVDRQRELEVSERRSRQTRDREERGATTNLRETHEETILEVLEEEEEIDEGRSLYQTLEVDNRDLCPPGEEGPISDLRVRYIPADPEERPEVQVVPQPCEPQTIAYLVQVIQNLNDPNTATYKIVCHQPDNLGQPVYAKRCYVSTQPPTVPCDRNNHPEPPPQRDERELGQLKVSPSSSLENTRALNEERDGAGLKEGSHQASSSKPDAAKGDSCRVKTKEGQRQSQRPEIPDMEKNQPQGDGSKAAREKVPREPGSSCQVREREDRKAKSCPPLLQAPEPREARQSERRDAEESRPRAPWREETGRIREDAELLPPEKSCQEDNSKRSPRQASDPQLPREEEPRLGTEKSQGRPDILVSQEEPSGPAGEEAKTS